MQSPFKFLDSYTREDHDIYFGRNSETEALYTSVFKSKMVLLYGVSGTGKSSLIQCGLANKFQESDWLPVFVRRGRDMLDSLFQSLIQTHIEAPREPKKRTAKSFLKLLQSLYLDHFKPVYLIFDQFEELFIFGNKEERNEFVQLMEALQQSEVQVKVIFSIREEYLAMLTEFEDRLPELFQNRIRVERMHFPQAKEVIQGACQYAKIEIEEGFEEQLLEKLTGGKKELELTYLQVLLDRLWKKSEEGKNGFTLTLLESMGHISDLLGQFLEEQINELEEPEQGLTVLKTFVSVQGTKKQLTFEEIHQGCLSLGKDVKESGIQDLLQRFTDLRILRDKDESGRYELRHDSLAAKIYEKITLAEKELMEVRQFVEQAYQLYEKKGIILSKDSLDYIAPYRQRMFLKQKIRDFVDASRHYYVRKAKRRRRILFSSIISIMIIAIVSGIFIWRDLQATRETARIATAHNLANEAMDLLQDDPKQAFKTAVDAYNMEPDFLSKKAVMNAYYQGPFERVKVNLRNVQEYDVTEDEKYFVVFREQASYMDLEVYNLGNGKLMTKANLPKSGLLPYAERWGGKSWLYDSVSQNIAVLTLDSILSVVHVEKGMIKQRNYQQRVYSLFDLDHDFCVATGDTIFKYDARGEQTNIYVPEAYIQQSILVDDKKHQYALVEKKENGQQRLELFDADSFVVEKRNEASEEFVYRPDRFDVFYPRVGIRFAAKKGMYLPHMGLKYFLVRGTEGEDNLVLFNDNYDYSKILRLEMGVPKKGAKVYSDNNVLIWKIYNNEEKLAYLKMLEECRNAYTVNGLLLVTNDKYIDYLFSFNDWDLKTISSLQFKIARYFVPISDSIFLINNYDYENDIPITFIIDCKSSGVYHRIKNVKTLACNANSILNLFNDSKKNISILSYSGDTLIDFKNSSLFFGDDAIYTAIGCDAYIVSSKSMRKAFLITHSGEIRPWGSFNDDLKFSDLADNYFAASFNREIFIYCVNDFQFCKSITIDSDCMSLDKVLYSRPIVQNDHYLLYFDYFSFSTFELISAFDLSSELYDCSADTILFNKFFRVEAQLYVDSIELIVNNDRGFFIFNRILNNLEYWDDYIRAFLHVPSDNPKTYLFNDSVCLKYNKSTKIIDTLDYRASIGNGGIEFITSPSSTDLVFFNKETCRYFIFDNSSQLVEPLVFRNQREINRFLKEEIVNQFLNDSLFLIAKGNFIQVFNLKNKTLVFEDTINNLDVDFAMYLPKLQANGGYLIVNENSEKIRSMSPWVSVEFCWEEGSVNLDMKFMTGTLKSDAFSLVLFYGIDNKLVGFDGRGILNFSYKRNYVIGMETFFLPLNFTPDGELRMAWRPGIITKDKLRNPQNPTYLLKLPVTVPRMFEVMQETGLDTTYGFDNIPKNF